jgi:hypothetical protein
MNSTADELNVKIAEAKNEAQRDRQTAQSINKGGFIAMMSIGGFLTVMSVVIYTSAVRDDNDSGWVIFDTILMYLAPILFVLGLIFTIINASRQHRYLEAAKAAESKAEMYETMLYGLSGQVESGNSSTDKA